MTYQETLVTACHHFTQVAAPYLYITDEQHYQETLDAVEALMIEVGEDPKNPLNAVIEMLGHAVAGYENQDKELVKFERDSSNTATDVAMLRLLMEQYELKTTDLPEIGTKSMVSRVLRGERELNKKHIMALAKRFTIEPGLFF